MSVKGSLRDISFIELMQLMHQSKKTGRIEITQDKKWAMIVFKEGVVWHVEPRGFHSTSPEDAIYSLVGMNDGSFIYQRIQILPVLERTVHMSMESLLMEGAKRADDATITKTESGFGADQQAAYVLKFKPGAEAKVRYVPQNVKKVLQAIDGQRNISEVVRLSQLEAAQAAQIIKELVAHGILEALEPGQLPQAAPPPPEG